jgi:hypothetical protein
MGERQPPIKDVAYPDDGVFTKKGMPQNDPFGHRTREQKVKDKPIKAGPTDSNAVGVFARAPIKLAAPKNEGEHPGIAAAKETLSSVVKGTHDGKVF